MKNRMYRLEDGLQETIQAALKEHMQEHVTTWAREVDECLIGEEACSVFVAMGWLTSRSDSRLIPVDPVEEGA